MAETPTTTDDVPVELPKARRLRSRSPPRGGRASRRIPRGARRGASRTTIKRSIDDGDVLVDGLAAKPSLQLRGGEEIERRAARPARRRTRPEDIPLDIVYEDEDLVVVNKPAGLVVHPAAGRRLGHARQRARLPISD